MNLSRQLVTSLVAGRLKMRGLSKTPQRMIQFRTASSSSKKTTEGISTEAKKSASPSENNEAAAAKSKIGWTRGYLGAHSNTDLPDAKFLAVATVVGGAGFYAWFIDPPAAHA